jgi:hypothetical protein
MESKSQNKQAEHVRFRNEKAILINKDNKKHKTSSSKTTRPSGLVNGLHQLEESVGSETVTDPSAGNVKEVLGFPKPSKQLVVGPGVPLDEYCMSLEYEGYNLSGTRMIKNNLFFYRFENCNMDYMDFVSEEQFYGGGKRSVCFSDVTFRGSSLQDVSFENCKFTGTIDLRETNLNGVRFGEVGGVESIDVRGSNITKKQYEYLCAKLKKLTSSEPTNKVIIDKYSVEDVRKETGLDTETLGVLMWSGEMDIRDRVTDETVSPSSFNPETHYVPQWVMQEFVESYKHLKM